jgi:hypothetical protein
LLTNEQFNNRSLTDDKFGVLELTKDWFVVTVAVVGKEPAANPIIELILPCGQYPVIPEGLVHPDGKGVSTG